MWCRGGGTAAPWKGWRVKTISYNLRKNRALGELGGLVDKHEIDILCQIGRAHV